MNKTPSMAALLSALQRVQNRDESCFRIPAIIAQVQPDILPVIGFSTLCGGSR
jgi:hypothetical protein